MKVFYDLLAGGHILFIARFGLGCKGFVRGIHAVRG